MKTIIVATNYSNDSNNAIKYASALAGYTNSKIILFNSFELPVHALNTLLPPSAVDELASTNKKRLKDIAFNISDTCGVTVECLTSSSDVKKALDCQVERLKADLVVMGMSEAHSGYWFGNTTTSVIQHAKYPILAVPEEASFGGISKILLAFDPACIYAANKLPLLMEVAACFKAQVEVCHIEKIGNSTTKGIHMGDASLHVETLLNDVNHSYKEIIEDNILKGIEKEIEDLKADLLVMVPHKYGFWEGIWHKSKTLKMVRRINIPLLTLPNPELGVCT